MVAKSFQSMKIISDKPFQLKDKAYVKVLNEKNGNERIVRWYTEKEYAKLYPEDFKKVEIGETCTFKGSQRLALGFEKGYITIFSNTTHEQREWFKDHNCRFRRMWGWSLHSTEEPPTDLPEGVKAHRLDWNLVARDAETLKSDAEVEKVVNRIIFGDSKSKHYGEVGERVELDITVTNVFKVEGKYGISNFFVMEDDKDNVFVWNTKSRDWSIGTRKTIRGTVKGYQEYKGVKQTVLIRCTDYSK